jgi:prepilin-type N-terminal cleavage/methylation domain-containing protein
MPATRPRSATGFTLLEVLIVLAVLGVLAGLIIPHGQPSSYARLEAVAAILGRDLDYARNLAVANDDEYKITFDIGGNRWILTHSGPNRALDALPITPLHRASDPANQQIVSVDDLPNVGGAPRLFAVWALTNPVQTVADVEFSSLGETTRAEPTVIWLAVGLGADTRYLAVRVNPITGLYWVENYLAATPSPALYAGS